MRYATPVLCTSVLIVLLAMSHRSPWMWAVLAGWEVCGVIWLIRNSTLPREWANRKRGLGPSNDVIVTVSAAIFASMCLSIWPLWVIVDDDVFG